MSTDKTLADVKPGGRVRLGDQDEKPPQELPELIVTRGDGIPLPDQAAGIEEFKRQCLRRIETEYPHLSAQPSPGGQGDAHVVVLQEMRARLTDAGSPARTAALDAAIAALADRQPVALIAQKVGDYRVTVAEDAITVSRGRDIVFAYSAGDAEPINARQPEVK